MSTSIYTVAIGRRTFLAVREQPKIGRPKTFVFSNRPPRKPDIKAVRVAVDQRSRGTRR